MDCPELKLLRQANHVHGKCHILSSDATGQRDGDVSAFPLCSHFDQTILLPLLAFPNGQGG